MSSDDNHVTVPIAESSTDDEQPSAESYTDKQTKKKRGCAAFSATLCLVILVKVIVRAVLYKQIKESPAPTLPPLPKFQPTNPTWPPSTLPPRPEFPSPKRGAWQLCSTSTECQNQCCSSKYSTSDGLLRCTPVGGFKPWEGCVGSATRRLRGNNEDEVPTADETNATFMHYAAPVDRNLSVTM